MKSHFLIKGVIYQLWHNVIVTLDFVNAADACQIPSHVTEHLCLNTA